MLDKFQDYLLINGKSYHTTKNYILRIEKLLDRIKEEDFTEDNLTAFLRNLQKEKSVSTVNGYLVAMIAYLKFIKKDIKLPKFLKGTKTLPQSYDKARFNDIITVLSQVLHQDFLKWQAILSFLFYTGIRVSEIDAIKREDIDLEKKRVKIFVAKTKEERIVYFPNEAKDVLIDYFDSEEQITNAFNINHFAIKEQIWRFKKYFPDFNLHAHAFRHSYATQCLLNGTDIMTVSKLLGHKNLQTTMRYLQLTNTQIEEIYRKYNDNKGEKK
jgi:integrase